MVYSNLDLLPKGLEEIAAGTALPVGRLAGILVRLQLAGLVTEVSKNQLRKIKIAAGPFREKGKQGRQRGRAGADEPLREGNIMAKYLVIVESPTKVKDHKEISGFQL